MNASFALSRLFCVACVGIATAIPPRSTRIEIIQRSRVPLLGNSRFENAGYRIGKPARLHHHCINSRSISGLAELLLTIDQKFNTLHIAASRSIRSVRTNQANEHRSESSRQCRNFLTPQALAPKQQ